ncbi:MAG: DHA2 family efflux MFS transporter permease subunit [Ilumatobacter sp.]|uniref:DHA2 family efflux MFS transporter permease subunit n=1 Tax=Ilumatobacter sp. TaxID=1967498 RepID=UPI00329781CC
MTVIDDPKRRPDDDTRPSPPSPAPAPDDLDTVVHERRWLVLGVLCLSLLIIVMDNTILNVAIPSLITDLGASNSQIQWIIDSYVIVFAGLLLTAGSLSDRFGRKGALQIGIVLFGLGSVAAALSGSAGELIAARAFMGIGGALIMPSTLSILTNVFRDPRERGRAIAVWAGFSGLGVAVGPMAGGFLLEHFSWHSVFWVNLPLGATALLLGAFLVPTSRDPKQSRLDPVGAALSIVGLASLLFGIIEGPAKGWTHSTVLVGFAVGIVALGSFIAWELHTAHPMLDVSVFRNARFSAASGTITMVFFALFGSLFLMTQYWQLVHGYSPLQAGVRLLPQAFTMMLVAPMSARLVERAGTKRVVLTGLVLIMVGLSLLSLIQPETPYVVVISFLVVMSAGMGMTMAPATESIMGSLPREKAGVGSAINDTTRQVGGALGVAIVGSAVSSVYASRLTDLAEQFGLSSAAGTEAQASLGGAQRVAAGLGADAARFLDAANQSFVDSMSVGLRVGVAVVAAAALMAWRFLPAHATDASTSEPADIRPAAVGAPGGSPSVVGAAAPAGASLRSLTSDGSPGLSVNAARGPIDRP